jgi:hypothetical protein
MTAAAQSEFRASMADGASWRLRYHPDAATVANTNRLMARAAADVHFRAREECKKLKLPLE